MKLLQPLLLFSNFFIGFVYTSALASFAVGWGLECPLIATKLLWELLPSALLGFGEAKFAALFNTVTLILCLFNILSSVLSLALSCAYWRGGVGEGALYTLVISQGMLALAWLNTSLKTSSCGCTCEFYCNGIYCTFFSVFHGTFFLERFWGFFPNHSLTPASPPEKMSLLPLYQHEQSLPAFLW